MKTAPTFDDIIGCRVDSVKLFAVSMQLHLSDGERRFTFSSIGDVDLGEIDRSKAYLSDSAVATLRDIVEGSIERISRSNDGIWIYFEQGGFIRIRSAEGADYLVSYREEGRGSAPEVFEGI